MQTTCGNCENLRMSTVTKFAWCSVSMNIVPHAYADQKQDKPEQPNKWTFWRIPIDCPKTSGVKKSTERARHTDWVVKTNQQ